MKNLWRALVVSLAAFPSLAAAVPEVVTVKVGALMTLTGPIATWLGAPGKAEVAYFKDLNKKGGLAYTEPDGSKHRFVVDLKYEDIVYDTKKTVIGFGRMKDWGAHLVTVHGSATAAALVAPSARDKVPTMQLWAVHPDPDHYRGNVDKMYLLPAAPTNVDLFVGVFYQLKKYVWDVKHPGKPLKVGIIAFDNPVRRLYKEPWVKDLYAKAGIELTATAIVPTALVDSSLELRRMHSDGVSAILIDHTIAGAKVILDDAERLGFRKNMYFIATSASLMHLLEDPQFDGIYNQWLTPNYFSVDRTPAMEEIAKILLDEDPKYWAYRLDSAMLDFHVLDVGMTAIKHTLEKYGYEGLTRERVREALFDPITIDNKIYPKFAIDPQFPYSTPYSWLYQFDAKNKGYIPLGLPTAPGPSKFQPRWNPGDNPKEVLTGYYNWP